MAAELQQQLEELVDYVKTGVERQDTTVLGTLVAVAVVLLTIVILLFVSRKSNNRSAVLLLGTCDAGKTLLFSRLVKETTDDIMTVTSMESNIGNYKVKSKNKSLRIVDIPGHERRRTQCLDQHKHMARGVVFLVDSGTLMKEVKEVAEYLYTFLSDSVISNNVPPILVACTKSDLTLKKGKDVIKKNLAAEMNIMRVTRSAALQQLEGAANNNTFLGKRNKDFAFEDLKPLKVDFVECSSLSGKIDLSQVESWLVKLA
ncbi:signal recognition particle receptor subunit beta-like [Mizuhopecten yessoensis]|uniref:Signal recognition particle receptor subunit beta n=1 Tax=Mizuhopecten yessoensis TaxID=6573 RepID=A0A210PV01_MIZYE|nr:signal recognition particle receptor subunit beta-like [Mizuhopecten yessoensis]OWF40317.1 Signal recognition particle receptor subunit beta [Mizuhopecten yessoensis]